MHQTSHGSNMTLLTGGELAQGHRGIGPYSHVTKSYETFPKQKDSLDVHNGDTPFIIDSILDAGVMYD